MNAIFAAAGEIQEFCRARGWRFCVIGGLAVQRWGEPRLTRGVDVTLLTGFGNEPAFVAGALVLPTGRSSIRSTSSPPGRSSRAKSRGREGATCVIRTWREGNLMSLRQSAAEPPRNPG